MKDLTELALTSAECPSPLYPAPAPATAFLDSFVLAQKDLSDICNLRLYSAILLYNILIGGQDVRCRYVPLSLLLFLFMSSNKSKKF